MNEPQGLLKREFAPGAAIVAATLAVELGTFLLARLAEQTLRQSICATLMAAAVWTALAAPVFAASATGALRSLLRAGLVADAAFVVLLIVWLFPQPDSLMQGPMTFAMVLEVYCTYAAMSVLAAFAVNCVRDPVMRYIVAVAVAIAMMLALASPLWTSGLIEAMKGDGRDNVRMLAVWLNPLYSVTSATSDSLQWVIHQEGLLYDRTRLTGQFCPWFAATLIYLPLGLSLLGADKVVCMIRAIRAIRG